MMYEKSYKQALKTPATGWKYADNEQASAAMAESIGHMLCIQPHVVYHWIMEAYDGQYLEALEDVSKHKTLDCCGAILAGERIDYRASL